MISGLVRAVLVLLVAAVLIGLFFGYRWGNNGVIKPQQDTVGAAGRDTPIDTSRARETGAKVGQAVATAANQVVDVLADGEITAKIKSKMALDEIVKARSIDVDTDDGHVTVSGRVGSETERQRAVSLARETKGVKNVIDRLSIR
jgi:hyperosmotically inducible protein